VSIEERSKKCQEIVVKKAFLVEGKFIGIPLLQSKTNRVYAFFGFLLMLMKLCIPLKASGINELLQKIEEAGTQADIVELWLGELSREKLDWDALFAVKKTPYLLNCKGQKEGGNFQGTDQKKLEILLEGSQRGAEYVDLHFEFPEELITKFIQEKGGTDLILSAHFFQNTPEIDTLKSLADTMQNLGADIVKIATTATEERDLSTIMKLTMYLRERERRFIVLSMGALGKPSRIITPLLGGEMMFAALSDEEITAPGQMTAVEMHRIMSAL
jgi:3-dehydroquinate dehydratase type I